MASHTIVVRPPPSPRELTHVLRFRAAFGILAVIWVALGIVFFMVAGGFTIYSWASSHPVALTSDVKWILGIGLGVQGVGSPVLWRVVKFYFPS